MKRNTRRLWTIGLGLGICALILWADISVPRGVSVWLGYLVVVAAVAWLGDQYATLVLAIASTLLIAVGFALAPPGVTYQVSAANRLADILLLWSAAFLIGNRRQLLARVAAQAGELRARNRELAALNAGLERLVQERTAALSQANASLQAMSESLVAVQENERRAISRELHDESGQVLTAIIIHLRLLRESCERGETAAAMFDEVSRMANQLAEGLHRLAVDLRPASLDRAGLIPAVEQYVETYRKTHGLAVDLLASGFDGERLAPDLESSLYRIIQEALTNVARHAHASHVSLVLSRRPDAVAVIVEDDGIGFDVEAAQRSGRLGLAGMQERAELRGGRLTIESRPGATIVTVRMPCIPLPLLAA
jgi:signal transduction histidine kinase